MNPVWLFVDIAVACWLFSVLFQIGDFATARFDAIAARDRAAEGRSLPPRVQRLFWAVPLLAVLVGAITMGGAWSLQIILSGNLTLGIVVMLVVLVTVTSVAVLLGTATTGNRKPGYASLRHQLLDSAGMRLTPARIVGFREQFAAIDARSGAIRLGYKDRSKSTDIRRQLAELSKTLLVIGEPKRTGVPRGIRWSSANSYLFESSPLRLVPVALGMAVGVAAGIAITSQEGLDWPWAYPLIVVPAGLSYLLAVVGTRYSLAAKATWHAVHLRQRAEVLRLLDEFERSARKGVAGLGDRVTRALQILREQQQS